MENLTYRTYKFRAWSKQQANRFVAHIPDLLVLDADVRKWSDSGTDVIVTLQVAADLDQLNTVLQGMSNVEVIKKTISLPQNFKSLSY